MGRITPAVLSARLRLAMRHPLSSLSADEIVAKALEHRVYAAWSGGRCSTVALHLTLSQKPDIPVVFTNTGVEYPETVKYVRSMAKEWALNFHELKPETNFWAVVRVYGFPQLRGSGPPGRPRRPMCCKILKEDPPTTFARENGLDGMITGIRAEESRARALGIYQVGPCYYAKRDRFWKFHPVAVWSLKQLMAYIEENKIPLNPLYEKGLKRVGCFPCTGFTQWREVLSKTKPRFYKWLNREYQKRKGEPTLWEFADDEGCRQGETE